MAAYERGLPGVLITSHHAIDASIIVRTGVVVVVCFQGILDEGRSYRDAEASKSTLASDPSWTGSTAQIEVSVNPQLLGYQLHEDAVLLKASRRKNIRTILRQTLYLIMP